MTLNCVTVLCVRERKTYQEGVFIVGHLQGFTALGQTFRWCAVSVEPTVYTSTIMAARHACSVASDHNGPYVPDAEHDSQVDEKRFRELCSAQGVACPLPEPEPEAEPAATEGAPA